MLRPLCLLFCLLPLAAAGQTIEKAWGLEAAVHQGGRRISAGASVPFRQLERQDSLESSRSSYGLGLVFESRVDKIGFTAGARYFRTGYDFTETGDDGPGFGTDVERRITAQYLELPFELNFYQDISEKSRVSFALGAGANVHLKTVTEQTLIVEGVRGPVEEVDPVDDNFRPVVFSLNTALAFDRKFNEDLAVKIQPYFRFFLQGNLRTDFTAFNRNYFQTGVRLVVKKIVF